MTTSAIVTPAGLDRSLDVGQHARARLPVTEFIDRIDRLEALAGELDELVARTGGPASARWPALRAGLSHDVRAQPWVVTVRGATGLVGAALLVARPRHGAWVLRSMMQPEEQGWLAALDDSASEMLARALADSLRRIHGPWHLELRGLFADDPTLLALGRFLPAAGTLAPVGLPRLDCRSTVPLEHCLSRNTRTAVARARKRIADAGLSMALTWSREAGDVADLLGEIVELHRRRNHQLRGVAGLDEAPRRALFEETVRRQAAAGNARILGLRLDGALAAFAICFESAGRLYVYSNMASPDWLAYSPGTIANAEVVAAAHRDSSVNEIDWGPGVQRYKLSGERARVDSLVHFHAWSSAGFRLAWKLYDRVARR